MDSDISDAIESARSTGIDSTAAMGTRKRHSRNMVIAIVKHVLGEMEEGRTVREVLDQLATVRGF